ncbi:Crp/Fnr family transcriptional regulator [Polaromonas sp. DSR2-3-2]|uniref:Crp/Fnr family transcriptional regulator n=1 Tax=unclassified Polaromonas TaxID=2638319 RepID=UPI003CF44B76
MSAAQNHLIELLPVADRSRLLALCEPVELALSEVLCEPGEPTRHVYFPTQGYISLVALTDGSSGVEVGMVGREGMLGAQLVLGVSTVPLHALVQGPGMALRIATAPFKRELTRSAALRRGLNRYLYVLMAQQANSAACLRFHLISQRLARWLLISQDRAHSDSFYLTHEFLAYMLGMRRVGITAAASALQRDGLIEYHRGKITVLDRSGLEAAACSCYASSEQTYNDLLGSAVKACASQKPPVYVR